MSKSKVTIPDEAVEAAARAMVGASKNWSLEEWDAPFIPERYKDRYRTQARAALEAAAPHLMGQAWDEGEGAGGLNHAAEECPELEQIKNPYRTTA